MAKYTLRTRSNQTVTVDVIRDGIKCNGCFLLETVEPGQDIRRIAAEHADSCRAVAKPLR